MLVDVAVYVVCFSLEDLGLHRDLSLVLESLLTYEDLKFVTDVVWTEHLLKCFETDVYYFQSSLTTDQGVVPHSDPVRERHSLVCDSFVQFDPVSAGSLMLHCLTRCVSIQFVLFLSLLALVSRFSSLL